MTTPRLQASGSQTETEVLLSESTMRPPVAAALWCERGGSLQTRACKQSIAGGERRGEPSKAWVDVPPGKTVAGGELWGWDLWGQDSCRHDNSCDQSNSVDFAISQTRCAVLSEMPDGYVLAYSRL